MKTIAIALLFAFSSSFAADFDALDAAPQVLAASPTPANEGQRFKARIADNLRVTYYRLEQVYVANHTVLTANDSDLSPAEKIAALTPAQFTEVVTVQWQIYSILKSINPKADIQPPPTSSSPKASPTPKKK